MLRFEAAFALCRLLPLSVDADDAAESTSQANETVVEISEPDCGGGNGKIAEVGDELKTTGGSFTMVDSQYMIQAGI